MKARILCVDDEPNVLEAFRRQLRRHFEVVTAGGGPEGLRTIAENNGFAVIVSDLRMPEMDGIQFLARVRERSPDSVRIMLTGNADVESAIKAVNEGDLFRFLTKPCPPEQLISTLESGVEQYRLINAEKELLEKTLKGSIKILTDILSLICPAAFGRASRVRRLARRIAAHLNVQKVWQVEIAAMLSQVGCVTVPEETLTKVYSGSKLSPEEERMFRNHTRIGSDLIANIPRLEEVAGIIAHQESQFDGSNPDGQIPLGARILKVALDYDSLEKGDGDPWEAVEQIRSRKGSYDPEVVKALERVTAEDTKHEIQFVQIEDLTNKMILGDDIKSRAGVLLIAKGQEVTSTLKERLKNIVELGEVAEPIKVVIPW